MVTEQRFPNIKPLLRTHMRDALLADGVDEAEVDSLVNYMMAESERLGRELREKREAK